MNLLDNVAGVISEPYKSRFINITSLLKSNFSKLRAKPACPVFSVFSNLRKAMAFHCNCNNLPCYFYNPFKSKPMYPFSAQFNSSHRRALCSGSNSLKPDYQKINSLNASARSHWSLPPPSLLPPSLSLSLTHTHTHTQRTFLRIYVYSCLLFLLKIFCSMGHSYRLFRVVSAVVSEENVVGSSFSGADEFKLTYLEGNSWLWDVNGVVKLLVDPILVGNLDFGIPWLYDAAKKFLKNFQLTDLPEIDCLLITQSLDDHCHLKTLKPLSQKLPDLRVIATPNAKSLLDPLFRNVTYLEPGQSAEIEASNDTQVKVRATAGPVLGPPWQRPENGYLVSSPQGQLTLYYEPHCVYNKNFLEKQRADIVITPVIKQLLPNFTLVSGQEDAVQLAKMLNAKFIVPMKNGDLDSNGLLASIIQAEGTVASFKELLLRELPDAELLEPTPGVPLDISAPSKLS